MTETSYCMGEPWKCFWKITPVMFKSSLIWRQTWRLMKIWFCLQRHYHWSGSDDDTGSLSGIFWQVIIVFSSGCRQCLETRTKITNPCPCLSFFQPSTHFQAKHRYNNCCQTSIFKDLLLWFAACFSHQRKGGSVGNIISACAT